MRARVSVPAERWDRIGGACARRLAGLWLALLAVGVGLGVAGPAAAQTVLLWEAPGDDGTSGRAARYELRYRTSAVSNSDTLSWWNAATAVSGLPTPSAAGATDSVVVQGLDPGQTYYFIVRAADEVFNWSGFSNIAVRERLADVTPPAAITDLTATASGGAALPEGAMRRSLPGPDEPDSNR